jgi:predicted aspartyl protease
LTFGPRIFGENADGVRSGSEILSLRGPHVPVIVSGLTPPPVGVNTNYLQLEALIDTGATHIAIDMEMAEALDLVPVDSTSLGGIGGEVPAIVFAGLLEVPGLDFKEMVRFYSPKGAILPSKVILGRSFLRNYIMTYNGPDGTFVFYDAPGQIIHETPDD